jgi:hypothetical protein
MLESKLNSFQNWIMTNSTLTTRAKRDIISRLRRAIKLSNLDFGSQQDVFLSELRRNPKWLDIPVSSRTGIERSVKLFYKYLAEDRNNLV